MNAGETIVGKNFSKVDLQGYNLSDCTLARVSFKSANLSGANLANALLENCNLRHANLSGADLRGTCFDGCDLQFADLSNCITDEETYFGDCNLVGAINVVSDNMSNVVSDKVDYVAPYNYKY